jgi:hypothetical protein
LFQWQLAHYRSPFESMELLTPGEVLLRRAA